MSCHGGSFDHVQWTSPTDRIALSLHPDLLTRVLEETAHLEDYQLRPHFGLRDQHIESLLLALRSDLEDGSPAGPLYGESIATALAVYLQKRYGVPATKTTQYRGGIPGIRLNRVLEYIQANLGEDLKLFALAQTAGMSAHYFSELFKQSTGQSPHQYVLRARIERAKEHLRDSRVSVVEASAITGFVDQSYFTKVFRRIVGVTPTEFRASTSSSTRGAQSWGKTGLGRPLVIGNTRVGSTEMKEEVSGKPLAPREMEGTMPSKETASEDTFPAASDKVHAAFDVTPWALGIAEEVQSLLETGKLGDASRLILRNAMQATKSEFAFVGLLLDGGLLRLLAHDGLKWHATINREFYEAKMQGYRDNGYLDFFESNNLVSAVAHEKKAVLTNTPSKDPRSGGIPSGHPALHCFLGVPAIKNGEVVGMIGMANRPGGFAEVDLALIETLIPALTALYDSYCRLHHEDGLNRSQSTAG